MIDLQLKGEDVIMLELFVDEVIDDVIISLRT